LTPNFSSACVAVSTCNGEILEAAQKVPATGPLGLEGDRGQMEYRRIRLQELQHILLAQYHHRCCHHFPKKLFDL
jgi:hypothetical protein